MTELVNPVAMRFRLHLTIFIFLCSAAGLSISAYGQEVSVLPGRVVVRIDHSLVKDFITGKSGSSARTDSNISKITPAIPWAQSSSSGRSKVHPLSNIYFIDLNQGVNINSFMDSLNQAEGILYAEPYYLFKPLEQVNDPLSKEQEHLEIIQALSAWEIEKGDSSVLIGILDSGINPDHPDLMQNIYINENDPVNGLDDDGDGLVDNNMGWDIADNDNNPIDDTDRHGSWVTGVSSARTNNGVGISGIAYNARILPIKIFKSNTNTFSKGYEGIVLAADLGCDIINLSWGSAGSFSQFGQDVINYAVLEKDVAIVAAAGNTDGELDFYPASFEHVLSVAATDSEDNKAAWGTYSRFIDITAPGVRILTTDGTDGYIRKSGTSLSAPQAAGALALVRSRFPHLNAVQAMERIRVYSDPIYQKGENYRFQELLGKGRLNIYQALTGSGSPAVRVTALDINNGGNANVFRGDSLKLNVELTNYLYPTANLQITIRSLSPYVSESTIESKIGSLQTLQKEWLEKPVLFHISDHAPANEELRFIIEFKDGAYEDYQHFSIKTSPDRVNIAGGDLSMTIAGNGNLAYADDLYRNGIGLQRDSVTILKNAAILISTDGKVADNLPNNLLVPIRDNDFVNDLPIKMSGNSIADQYALSTFTTVNGLPFTIEQEALTWKDQDALILEYRITNTADTAVSNVRYGFFSDFDLGDPSFNKSYWLDSIKMTVTESSDSDIMAGAAIIANVEGYVYALDKGNTEGNASDIPNSIDDTFKYELLYSDQFDTAAGSSGSGNDVAAMLINPIGNLSPGESTKFAIVISAGSSIAQLTANLEKAKENYTKFRTSPPVLMTSLYCPGTDPVIDPPGDQYEFFLTPEADSLLIQTDRLTGKGLDTLQNIYVREVISPLYKSDIYRIPVRTSIMNTRFKATPDTLILDENNQTLVQFTDLSNDAVSWNWTFSNGYSSTQQNPAIHFKASGEYQVELNTVNSQGCEGKTSKSLIVLQRTPRPDSLRTEGCGDLFLEIPEKEGFNIILYSKEGKELGIFKTISFQEINRDSILYYTFSPEDGIESLPAPIEFDIWENDAAFTWYQDSTNLQTVSLLHFTASASFEGNWYAEAENGETWLGSNRTVSFNYEGMDTFSIRRESVSPEGCLASETQSFTPFMKPKPEDETIEICSEENLTIIKNGSIHHFYNASNELIHKGNTLELPILLRDTTFFVRDAGGLLESEAATLKISVTKPDVYFELDDNTINMALDNSVFLQAMGEDLVEYQWSINGLTVSTEPTLTYSFDEPGTFELELTGVDDSGCSNAYSASINVINITSSLSGSTWESFLYPNPAKNHMMIKNPISVRAITAVALSGKVIRTWKDPQHTLNLIGFDPGVYLFRIETEKQVFYQKIILNPVR